MVAELARTNGGRDGEETIASTIESTAVDGSQSEQSDSGKCQTMQSISSDKETDLLSTQCNRNDSTLNLDNMKQVQLDDTAHQVEENQNEQNRCHSNICY
uniref:Uncharacterized protein n=1 Tax=Arundo donax TaxID=35708 RepID=A0A0A9BMV7_ARUDO